MKGTKEIIRFLKNQDSKDQFEMYEIWLKGHYILNYRKQKHDLAFYDQMTQLKNHHYFDNDIQFLISYYIPFVLFFIKFNRLQTINETCGHHIGDKIVNQLVHRIKEMLQTLYDFDFYRMNRNEFMMVLPYIRKRKISDLIVKKILDLFSVPFNFEGDEIYLKPTIGIIFYPKDSQNKNTLLRYASNCIERLNRDTIKNYCYFDKGYYQKRLEEKKIETYIESIIKNKMIQLRYQPIYFVKDKNRKIICFEALLCDHYYGVQKLFEIALRSSLIISLEKIIIEKVIQDISSNKNVLGKDLRFTINLTPKTIEYIDVYEVVKGLLKKYQVDGKQVGFEITEQYYISDEKKINHLICQLQSLGIKIYLDDFGMGYSSVRNLTSLYYHVIKLDTRLINNIFINKKKESFLKRMIQFSKDVRKPLIIEGVETKEQFEYLLKSGAVYIQGYYLSKPIELNKAIQLIKKE